jgi:hypothetical protein
MHAHHQQPMAMQYPVGLHLGGDYAHHQQHAAAGRVSYDTHEEEEHGGHHGRGIGGSALLGRKHAPDRRPLRFWQPFNGEHAADLALHAAVPMVAVLPSATALHVKIVTQTTSSCQGGV